METSPDEEGIKTDPTRPLRRRRRLWRQALMKKGLRPAAPVEGCHRFALETSPDEEGIKTSSARSCPRPEALWRQALMKKGLRQQDSFDLHGAVPFGDKP